MNSKFYTIDEVAELLGMHHKTIRNFIKDKKLNAVKVGKQWRISTDDFNNFLDNKNSNKVQYKQEVFEEFSSGEDLGQSKSIISVSTVVEIKEVTPTEYSRISNTLIALANSKNNDFTASTINLRYSQEEREVKILLWGSILFIEKILDTIKILTN